MLVGLFAVWPLPKAKHFGDVLVAAETSQALVTGQLDRTESLTCDISLVKQSQGVDCPIPKSREVQKSGRPYFWTGHSVIPSNERENRVVASCEITRFSTISRVTRRRKE